VLGRERRQRFEEGAERGREGITFLLGAR
jgi:hypothetical protein